MAITRAGGGGSVAVVVHVNWCHGHDRNHDQLGDYHDQRTDPRAGAARFDRRMRLAAAIVRRRVRRCGGAFGF